MADVIREALDMDNKVHAILIDYFPGLMDNKAGQAGIFKNSLEVK